MGHILANELLAQSVIGFHCSGRLFRIICLYNTYLHISKKNMDLERVTNTGYEHIAKNH